MQVGAIPRDLIGITAYSSQTSQATFDIAYDLWLHDSNTKQPCNTKGALEVMVWTDYDQRALLPANMQVGTASIPFATRRGVANGKQAWSVYVSNLYAAGRTAPWGGTVWFVLNRTDVVSKGTVSVDLSSVLSAVGALVQNDYHWNDFRKRYWLDSIPFGMEFGPRDGSLTGTGSSHFGLELSSYCLEVGTTLNNATCTDLSSR